MHAIEFEATIKSDGTVQLPEEYYAVYGQKARLLILFQDTSPPQNRKFNPMAYGNTLHWPVDGMEYQTKVRAKWE